MEVKKSQLIFEKLQNEELNSLRKDGVFSRTVFNKELNKDVEVDYWIMPEIASFGIEGENGLFDVTMVQIGIDHASGRADMGIFKGVDGNNDIKLLYWVEVTLANYGYRENEKFFTDLTEAIDYYNKIKNFIKAEIKDC